MTESPHERSEELKERLRRRLVAARVLAGLGQVELAERIKAMGYARGYSARTIGDMERGETSIQPQSIPVLAEACDVTPAFFSIDFRTLEEPDEGDDDLQARLTVLEAQQIEDAVRLAQLEEAVQALAGTGHQAAPTAGGQQ
jgi:transcriptional regulator with XRE-family HTH domain